MFYSWFYPIPSSVINVRFIGVKYLIYNYWNTPRWREFAREQGLRDDPLNTDVSKVHGTLVVNVSGILGRACLQQNLRQFLGSHEVLDGSWMSSSQSAVNIAIPLGGFKVFLNFHPDPCKDDPISRAYFSDGLKPTTFSWKGWSFPGCSSCWGFCPVKKPWNVRCVCIYIYIYIWHLFWLEFRPCFDGFTFKIDLMWVPPNLQV